MGKYPSVPPIATGMEHTYRCKICGMPDNLGYYSETCDLLDSMRIAHICYNCAFWKNEIEHPSPDREIIGGKCYVIHPADEDLSSYNVGDGSIVGADCYVFHPDWTIYRSFSMYCLGEIPKHFREQFPDTAKFITPKAFRKIAISGTFKCHAKGCWDRYHCLRYDMNTEKDGAYNEIPSFYTVGCEKCPSFINLEKDLYV